MFISVVIPTYNRAQFIATTINSILCQHHRDFEIIVVDDGSIDNTEEVVSSIKDHRISYHKKSNEERAAARNFGAHLAKGAYINFFDSDDVAYPNHLTEAVNAINTLKFPEIFHLGYDVKDTHGKVLGYRNQLPATINNRMIDGNYLSCNGVFIKKEIALLHPFNENRSLSASEDYELWLRLAARYPIYCVNVITSTVVNHDDRSVLRINEERFTRRFELLQAELMKDAVFFERYKSKLNVFQSYIRIYMALHMAMAGFSKKKAMRHLIEAARLKPDVIVTRRFLAALKNIWL